MSTVELRSSPRVRPATASIIDTARICVPEAQATSVPRTALVNRLRATPAAVVTLVAPAGYGKTNVLAQWAARDERSFAWLSVAEGDDRDAVTLCRALTAALGPVDSFERADLDRPGARRRSARAAIRSLVSSISPPVQPFVLVLDDAHLLRSRESADVVRALAERFPDGSTLVLSGRALPRLPTARLRIAGRLVEVGCDQLALSRRESDTLARQLTGGMDEAKLAELAAETEGWAAGVQLAVLRHEDASASEAQGTQADRPDRLLADYFDFEHLSGLSASDVRFLTRTSVLDSLCGSLCDAVLESKGSARRLSSLSRSNLFVFPVEHPGEWFRYHRQFHAFLRGELERREPDLIPVLNRRASAWCEANGAPESAISYAHAAGDIGLVARLVVPRVLPMWSAGHCAAVETWLGWFDEAQALERHPALALLGAWTHALRGRAAEAERWFEVGVRSTVEDPPPDGSASLRPWIALVRAAMCRAGAEKMQADAELALRELGPASRWRPTALLLLGAAHLLRGENERAEAAMADAAEEAASLQATPTQIAALAEWSLLAADRGDEERAEALAAQARGVVDEHGLDEYVQSALAYAVSARRGLHAGDSDLTRAELEKARALRGQLSHALPWHAVRASLELAQVELSVLDVPGARAWLSHAREIVRRRPDLGVLPGRLRDVEAEIDTVAKAQEQRSSTLTAAEVRLLPFLATHLSFREIGEELHVSRNTVKTQAISIYRKLRVCSRSEAIERAARIGLADARPGAGFTRTG